LEIRKYEKRDTEAIIKLFKETIIKINRKDYSKDQVETWANSSATLEEWDNRLKNSITYVVVIDHKIVGFGNLTANGEIDLLYTHKNFQGQGIGAAIVEKLENDAKMNDLTEMTTEASITAKRFFESKGYVVLKQQIKKFKGTEFINYIMKKKITYYNR
jgi:putative acetyltransferase